MAVNSKAGKTKEGKFVSPCYCCAWCGEGFETVKAAEEHENLCEIRGDVEAWTVDYRRESNYDTHQIQSIIRNRVSKWEPRIWAWPHDTFAGEPWGYAIHAASVGAWNAEGRLTPCVEFLLAWATIENINAALQADAAQSATERSE